MARLKLLIEKMSQLIKIRIIIFEYKQKIVDLKKNDCGISKFNQNQILLEANFCEVTHKIWAKYIHRS